MYICNLQTFDFFKVVTNCFVELSIEFQIDKSYTASKQHSQNPPIVIVESANVLPYFQFPAVGFSMIPLIMR